MPMSYLWRIPTGKIRLGSDRTVNLLRNQNHLSVRKSPLEIRQMKSWSRYYDFRLSCTIFGTNNIIFMLFYLSIIGEVEC